MPSLAFQAALPFILRWEGGYVDHPADPGGRTNKGITQGVYDRWRVSQGLPARHVRLIDDAEVQTIYETGYWIPPRCDLLRRKLDLVHFDTAVNMGPGRAVRFLQGALRCSVDGAFGSRTERAAAECELLPTIEAYCNARQNYYRRLTEKRPELGVFLKGWTNRVNALKSEVGVGGREATLEADFGESGYIARIPDLGIDPAFDLEEP
jgi:lysozyme family protein